MNSIAMGATEERGTTASMCVEVAKYILGVVASLADARSFSNLGLDADALAVSGEQD